jgi:hypothetical protein
VTGFFFLMGKISTPISDKSEQQITDQTWDTLQLQNSGCYLVEHSMWVDSSSRVDPKATFVQEFLGTDTSAAGIWDFEYNPVDPELTANFDIVLDMIGGFLGGRRLFTTSTGYIKAR